MKEAMPGSDTQVLEFDSEEEAIAARFLLEIYEAAGEEGLSDDEVDQALRIFQRQRVTFTMVEMWDAGLFQVTYLPDRNDLGYRLTEYGEHVAELLQRGEDLDEVAEQIASVAKAVNSQQ